MANSTTSPLPTIASRRRPHTPLVNPRRLTANRTILVETMLEVDFSNCRDEWWQYSWGDAGWAVRMSETECFYGSRSRPRAIRGGELERFISKA